MNDYHAFTSTNGSSNGSGGGAGCGSGCFTPTSIAIAIVVFIIYLIGKCGWIIIGLKNYQGKINVSLCFPLIISFVSDIMYLYLLKDEVNYYGC